MRNWLLPLILAIFALISLITLKSIAPNLANDQLVFWMLGLIVFGVSSRIRPDFWQKFHWGFYVLLIGSLILTLLVGQLTRGTARWIKIGDLFRIQPSQLAVPLVGLSAAAFAAQNKLNSLKKIIQFLALVGVPAILILIEPDLGTTLVFLLSTGIVLFLSEIKTSQLLSIIGIGVVGFFLAWNLILQDYQKQRIFSFLGVDSSGQATSIQERKESNYNSWQSQIAVGSGQLLGKGLGHGSQSHLKFLPERQTDFIFASFAEEWGFIGTIILIGLYILMISLLLIYALRIKNKFASYYLLISLTFISFQTFVNMGMNIGLLPITGLTLPFVSYGGSSLLSLCLMLGIDQSLLTSYQKKVTMEIG